MAVDLAKIQLDRLYNLRAGTKFEMKDGNRVRLVLGRAVMANRFVHAESAYLFHEQPRRWTAGGRGHESTSDHTLDDHLRRKYRSR